ncbi:MAG TPA: hypothetical protein ENF26_01110 [Methanomicrobia archaeon]|nr:hypothetical protein [Methanomicrobia archaeon]HEX58731.1 hypothetical protein [Methanomicrobia archaeon]
MRPRRAGGEADFRPIRAGRRRRKAKALFQPNGSSGTATNPTRRDGCGYATHYARRAGTCRTGGLLEG